MTRETPRPKLIRVSGRVFKIAGLWALVAVFLLLCLFLDTTPVRLSRWLGPIAAEVLAAFRDPGTQWMVYACCLVYFGTFTLLEEGRRKNAECRMGENRALADRGAKFKITDYHEGNEEHEEERQQNSSAAQTKTDVRKRTSCPSYLRGERFWFLGNPDLWLCVLVAWVTVGYALDYETASRNTHALALIAGAAIAKGAGLWSNWNAERGARNEGKEESRRQNEEGAVAEGEHSTPSSNVAQPSRLQTCLTGCRRDACATVLVPGCLLLLLAVAALWQPEAGTTYQYRGQARWQGPWDNPNIYGLLMGVGFVLAVAQASRLLLFGFGYRRDACATVGRGLLILIFVAAAGLCGYGLLRSYSRGAWVGVALALGYLASRWTNHKTRQIPGQRTETELSPLLQHGGEGQGEEVFLNAAPLSDSLPTDSSRGERVEVSTAEEEAPLLDPLPTRASRGEENRLRPRSKVPSCISCPSWLKRNSAPLGVLILSLLVLAFWELRYTEQPLIRRVFTVGNPNDFSWRNRIAAWEGALAMMAERPFTGVGWSRTEAMYDHYYRPVKVDEGMAIQLNHYFVLGMAAGLPALVCFLGYVGLSLTRSAECGVRNNVLPRVPPADQTSSESAEDQGENCQRDAWQHVHDVIAHSPSSILNPPSSIPVVRAGALVLLVGLWFDGGLFNLATAAPLWMLLELGRADSVLRSAQYLQRPAAPPRPDRLEALSYTVGGAPSGNRSAELPFGKVVLSGNTPGWRPALRSRVSWFAGSCTLILALLLTGLVWAHARNPFRRVHLNVQPEGFARTEVMAVMPARGGPFPLVLWAYGSGGDLMRSGDELRQIAELGLAAVAFEYDKTNEAHFDAQMRAVLDVVSQQSWTRSNAVGWIAHSLGAQRTLSFALWHPKLAPKVTVRMAGGKEEVRRENAESKQRTLNIQRATSDSQAVIAPPSTLNSKLSTTTCWLIHGENDEVFPVEDARELAKELKAAGASVRLSVIPGRGHSFGPDQPALVHAAAEFCAEHLGATKIVPVNVRASKWWMWLPVGLTLVGILALRWRRTWRRREIIPASRWVIVPTAIGAGLALLDTAVHLALPQLPVTVRTAALAESFVVRPELKESFHWLANRTVNVGELQSSAGITPAAPIGVLLEHDELATLQRELSGWTVENDVWQDWVMNPVVGSPQGDLDWRRTLWEAFYPRVRHEASPSAAAEIAARYLSERITIRSEASGSAAIAEMWAAGVADGIGFERLYVAALRSMGVPARMGSDGLAAFHDGERWRPAPRPLGESLLPR